MSIFVQLRKQIAKFCEINCEHIDCVKKILKIIVVIKKQLYKKKEKSFIVYVSFPFDEK